MSDILTELINKVRKGVIRLEDIPTDKLILIKDHYYHLLTSLKIKNIKEGYVFYKNVKKHKNTGYTLKIHKNNQCRHIRDLDHQYTPTVVLIERVLNERNLDELSSKGHTLKTSEDFVDEWNSMIKNVVLGTLKKAVNQLIKEGDDNDFTNFLNETILKTV